MVQRSELFSILRPNLKGGWTPGLIKEVDDWLTAAGIPAADEPPRINPPSAPLLPPSSNLSFAQKQIDLDFLDLAFPANNPAALGPWVEATQTACVRWGIDTFREVCSFLANINEETAGLTLLEESLNYSVEALISKFGRHRISIADANKFGRGNGHPANQQALANILYGGEWGLKNLGNKLPGDGWKFKGYGPKQLTGRRNQSDFAEAVGMSVEDVPAYVRTPVGGMMSAGWFWKSHDLDAKAATPGLEDDRRAINGGTFGLAGVEVTFNRLIEELLRREKALS